MNSQLICLALVLCALHSACGLYFHMSHTERKCFIEDVPDETTVIVNYKVELYDPRSNGFMPSSPGIGMHVEVRDRDDKVILSRVYSSQGRMSFTSHMAGEHEICMNSNSTAWLNGFQLRVHQDIQVGEHAIDYANVAQKEKLTELELRIRQLLDQVEQIMKEQNYLRYREDLFRNTSKSTNFLVAWWSLVQVIVLVCLSFLQILHLKRCKDPSNNQFQAVANEIRNDKGSTPNIDKSKINHNCIPNAQFTLSDSKRTAVLKAIIPIQKDKEISISHLNDCQLESSPHYRDKTLRENCIFVCQCPHCREETSDDVTDVTSDEQHEVRDDRVN